MRRLSRVQNSQDLSVGLVLIHGEGLGGWIWQDVLPYLNFDTLLAEFPARNQPYAARASLTFDDYEQHLLKQINPWNVDRVVLVAHSMAGILALKLAQDLAGRMMGMVAIGSVIPGDGGSYISTLPLAQRLLTYTTLMVSNRPPDKIIERHLCNGITEKYTREILQTFTRETSALYLDRCNASPPWAPSMYMKLTQDHELGPGLQDQMSENLGAREQHVIHSGHMPMLSHPLFLATIVNDFTQDLISGIRPTYSVPAKESLFSGFLLNTQGAY